MNDMEYKRSWIAPIVAKIPGDTLRKVLLIMNNPTPDGENIREIFMEEGAKRASGGELDSKKLYRLMIFCPPETLPDYYTGNPITLRRASWTLSPVHFYDWKRVAVDTAKRIEEGSNSVEGTVVEIFEGTYWEALRECQIRNHKIVEGSKEPQEENEDDR